MYLSLLEFIVKVYTLNIFTFTIKVYPFTVNISIFCTKSISDKYKIHLL
jgi:hypothetical protein